MSRPVIFLASRTEEENQILKHKLTSLYQEFGYHMRFISMHPQGLARSVQEESVSVVMINLPEWNRAESIWVREVRGTGFSGPILVTAKVGTADGMNALQTVEDFVFLEKPYDPKDLVGIVSKMLTARQVAQRIHRRYNTDQNAEIELYGKNDRFRTKVCNLSKGGAYLQCSLAAPLRNGDMVRVHMELQELSRTYTMPARVVWVRPGANGAGSGVGVEFMGPADIKKSMISF